MTHYQSPDPITYGFLDKMSLLLSLILFRRRIVRNELKEVTGPFVLLVNHECALDCVNLAGLTKRRLTFVVSKAFFNTLPVRPLLAKTGVIDKQQFKTTLRDMQKMKAVIDNGEGLVLFPAGLMSENGLSTPIPEGTWRFLKWLGCDIYAVRISGSYFVMPKWSSRLRPGRTYVDVYKLFTAAELKAFPATEIKTRCEDALLFDAYREQEKYKTKYKNGNDVRGLENVLYMCPECGSTYNICVDGIDTLRCSACGFTRVADSFGLMSDPVTGSTNYRYASDWSKKIKELLRETISDNFSMSLECDISVIDFDKKCFRHAGSGIVRLDTEKLRLNGLVDGKAISLCDNVAALPYLPFSPGRCFDIQTPGQSYRCYPKDSERVMEFINALSILHEKSRNT